MAGFGGRIIPTVVGPFRPICPRNITRFKALGFLQYAPPFAHWFFIGLISDPGQSSPDVCGCPLTKGELVGYSKLPCDERECEVPRPAGVLLARTRGYHSEYTNSINDADSNNAAM